MLLCLPRVYECGSGAEEPTEGASDNEECVPCLPALAVVEGEEEG